MQNPWHIRPNQGYSPQTLLDTLADALVVVEAHGEFSYANPKWQQLFESQNAEFESVFHPQDLGLWQEMLSSWQPGRSSGNFRARLIGRDQRARWYELRMQALEPNKLFPVSVLIQDCSDHVAREQQLFSQHRSLVNLVDDLPFMIYRGRNTRSWTMEYVSAGCFELTGYKAQQLINQSQINFGELIVQQDADAVWQGVQEALLKQSAFELHYQIEHADGGLRSVREKGKGIYSSDGAVLGVAGVIFRSDN